MTRILSTALKSQRIDHVVKHGSIKDGEGRRIVHFWIELPDKKIIDLRARMWMGEKAPHGIFENNGLSIEYEDDGVVQNFEVSEFLYMILSGKSLQDAPLFPADNPDAKLSRHSQLPEP